MAEALGAAVLGKSVSKLWDTVENAINTTLSFEAELESLKSTLGVLKSVIEEIEHSHRELGRREEETEGLIKKISKGDDRVRKCSTLPRWNYYKRYSYAKILRALDLELIRFFQLEAQALSWRTGEENSLRLQGISATLGLAERDGGWVSCPIPGLPKFSVGLGVHLKKLKMQLLKEEVSLLLLTAPGGCGKTTLVKLLCHDKEIKDIYKGNLFFVTVSKTPNLKVIIQTLFDQKGDRVLEFQSDEDAINKLEQYLLKRIADHPILLILDDVWSEEFIEHFVFGIPKYKILVTSRTAFRISDFIYELKPLNDKDSMTLFRHSANLPDTSSSIPEEDVKKIVKGCGGFPLAIKVIGKSLKGRPAAVWHNYVTSDHSIFSKAEGLLLRLQSSIALDDKLEHHQEFTNCFMDLGSFPEDQRIRVDALIDMWSELSKRGKKRSNDKGFREKIKKDAMNAIGMLDEIAIRNLTSSVVTRKDASHEVGSYCTEDFVLQHDLLRELAIYLSSQEPIEQRKRLILDMSGNNVLEWWTEQPVNASLLSITTDEEFSSSDWCINILPTKVEVLVLNFQSKEYTLPVFVEKMEKLKVLIVTNYGFFSHADLRNFQLLVSAPNLKRIRLEKISVHSLWETLVQLNSLEKISLFMCDIGQAFTYVTIKKSEVLPNLTEINIDYCKDLVKLPVELCDIVHLKKLSITNCHKLDELPEEIGKLVNLEVLRVRSCTGLSKLPDAIRDLRMLSMFDISGCLIKGLPEQIGELNNLEELHMKGCSQLGRLPKSTKDLAKLERVICDEERIKLLWGQIKEAFHPNLESLEIKVVEEDINLDWLITNHF